MQWRRRKIIVEVISEVGPWSGEHWYFAQCGCGWHGSGWHYDGDHTPTYEARRHSAETGHHLKGS